MIVVFDGGAIGNPGAGYGSYAVSGAVATPAPVRIKFPGNRTTNNQAEYRTLIAALEWVFAAAEQQHIVSNRLALEIYSDSQLVVEQVNGRWKIRKADLLPRVNEVRTLLQRAGEWSLTWHPRSESVRILGH